MLSARGYFGSRSTPSRTKHEARGRTRTLACEKQNFQEILTQLQAITKVAEEIRVQIAGGLRLGQTRCQLKRELYVHLLEGLVSLT
jgi:hypothetical protein